MYETCGLQLLQYFYKFHQFANLGEQNVVFNTEWT